jgi:predicted nucleic acid-binding protein
VNAHHTDTGPAAPPPEAPSAHLPLQSARLTPVTVIIDTNVVLDTFVFADPTSRPLRQGLEAGRYRWVATAAMRDELQRVLAYPQIVRRLAFYGLTAEFVLASFDRHVACVPEAGKAPWTCKDPDDQKFIDLAVAYPGYLLSKDQAVLCMQKRLASAQVHVQRHLLPETPLV